MIVWGLTKYNIGIYECATYSHIRNAWREMMQFGIARAVPMIYCTETF